MKSTKHHAHSQKEKHASHLPLATTACAPAERNIHLPWQLEPHEIVLLLVRPSIWAIFIWSIKPTLIYIMLAYLLASAIECVGSQKHILLSLAIICVCINIAFIRWLNTYYALTNIRALTYHAHRLRMRTSHTLLADLNAASATSSRLYHGIGHVYLKGPIEHQIWHWVDNPDHIAREAQKVITQSKHHDAP